MNKNSILKALGEARKQSKKRKFSQTVELIINFKNLDVKKTDNQLDFFMTLKNPWKEQKICGMVGAELSEQSKKTFNHTIISEDFDKYKDKKMIKKLAREYDYFVAQANLMPKIATVFGRYLGPLGKMPNPKAGCIVLPNANLEPIKAKLSQSIHIQAKVIPLVQLGVGKEETKDEDIADNILAIYDQVVHHLPQEKQNIKSAYVKLTMGKSVRVEAK